LGKADLMRAVVQLLFILFYVGSSYVTTQHRLTYIVHRLEHSNSRDNHSSLESCKEGIRYTHFREAKKAGTDFNFGTDGTPNLAPMVSDRQFTLQTSFYKPQFDIEARHSRAPPSIPGT
jgi:hypothetical protein